MAYYHFNIPKVELEYDPRRTKFLLSKDKEEYKRGTINLEDSGYTIDCTLTILNFFLLLFFYYFTILFTILNTIFPFFPPQTPV